MRGATLTFALLCLCAVSAVYAGSYKKLNTLKDNKDYTVEWGLDASSKKVMNYTFTLHNNEGWAGIGVASDNDQMPQTDIAMMYMGPTSSSDPTPRFYAFDCWAEKGKARQPVLDVDLGGEDNIIDFWGEDVDGVRTFSFTKELNTGDKKYDTVIKDEDLYVLWAFNPDYSSLHFDPDPTQYPSKIIWHDKNHGSAQVNMLEPNAEKKTRSFTLFRIHAIAMFTAWVFCAIAGNYVARYLKNALGVWWFRLHIILQVSCILLTIGGAVVQFFFKGKRFTTSGHSIIGYCLVFLCLVQAGFGMAADRMWFPGRAHTPVIPDKVHWWLGRTMILAALVNTFLGAKIGQISEVWMGALVGTAAALYIGFYVYAEYVLAIPKESKHDRDGNVVEDVLPLKTVESRDSSGKSLAVTHSAHFDTGNSAAIGFVFMFLLFALTMTFNVHVATVKM